MNSIINPKHWVRVKTYADTMEVSVQYIYKLIKQGKVESLKIDGVQFVKYVER